MAVRRVLAGRGRTVVRDWLADEIVVDFPSMPDVVDRMYRSFLGADDDGRSTHLAEVELTPQEAGAGIRLPLDLPLRLTCPVCGGRGEVWSEVCGICAGAGGELLPHQLDLRVPPGVHHGTRLRYCVNPPFAAETHVEVRIAIP